MKKFTSFLALILLLAYSAYFDANSVKAATEVEDNDSFSKATSLPFSVSPYEKGVLTTSITGDVENSWDYDYYRISLTTPGKITIKITPNQSSNFEVELFNSSQNEMEDWNTVYSDEQEPVELFSNGLRSGTYFIRISHYEGESNVVPYELAVDYTPSQNYEQEDNDSRSQANWIKTGQIYKGYSDSYGNDYYAFTLDKSGEVKININRNATTRYYIKLYNNSGSEMESWYTYYQDGEGTNNVIHTGLPAGTYYVNISNYDNNEYNTPYSLSVNFTESTSIETEDNDSESRADLVGIGQNFNGIISSDNDYDYYRITIPKTMDLNFLMTRPASTEFEVKIFDQSYNTYKDIYTNYGTGSIDRLFNLSLKPGTYFIRINQYDGEDNKVPYTFKLIEKDTTAPAVPTVNAYTDKSTILSGTAEANSTINVRQGSRLIKSGKAGSDGKFSITLSKIAGGTTLYVTAKDADGNESKPAVITVKDTTAPSAPVVNEIKDYDRKVSGKTEAYSAVTVKIGNTTLAKGTADKYGYYTVNLKYTLKAGTVVAVTSADRTGNISAATIVSVKDKTAPGKPTVNKVTANSTTVTGKAEANSTVYVIANNRQIGTAKATNSGSYSVKISKQRHGTALYVYAKDAAGNKGALTKVIVQK